MGASVSLAGDFAAVGAPFQDSFLVPGFPVTNAGKVFIFNQNLGGDPWILEDFLDPPNPIGGGEFGKAVALKEFTVVVGAPGENAVYLFERNVGGYQNWGLVATIGRPADIAGLFGFDLAFDTTRLLIGAPTVNSTVFLYEKNDGNWQEISRAFAEEPNDRFRYDMDMSGDNIGIGAALNDDIAYNAGSVLFYEYVQEINPDDPQVSASNGLYNYF